MTRTTTTTTTTESVSPFAPAVPATPWKLRNGSWGAIAQGRVVQGSTLMITTRSGKSWLATVTRVLWTKDGKSGCATESLDRAPARRPQRGVDYCGYPCPVDGHRCTAARPCHDCL